MPIILYAEDDPDCRELFAIFLRMDGHEVFEAVNGAQAVQIVRDEQIDLAILDVRMPMMTGYDAAALIGREAPSVPIIFLSARGHPREVERAFGCASSVVDYLVKPVAPAQLVRQVDKVLQVSGSYGLGIVRQESLAREDLAHVRLRP